MLERKLIAKQVSKENANITENWFIQKDTEGWMPVCDNYDGDTCEASEAFDVYPNEDGAINELKRLMALSYDERYQ